MCQHQRSLISSIEFRIHGSHSTISVAIIGQLSIPQVIVPAQQDTKITNGPGSRCRALFKIRNTATECLPGRVANDKIGASLGESSQRVPPTASERGVHVFFAGPRQVMAKSITKDIVQCLPNNSKLTCRFVLYLLLPGSLRLLRSTSLPGALVLGITSVLRPKLCTVVISSILDVDAYVHTMPKRVVCKETAGSPTAHDESCPCSRTLEIRTHQDQTAC